MCLFLYHYWTCIVANSKIFFVIITKGQLISKCLFGIFNSPKKRTKKFNFTTTIPQVDLFSFVFWEKLKTPKRHFKINWPLGPARAMKQLSYYEFWVCVVHLIHCIGRRLIGTYLPYFETAQNLSRAIWFLLENTHYIRGSN